MRKPVFSVICFLALVLLPVAVAQEPEEPAEPPHPEVPPFLVVPEALEEMIDVAMGQNPELRLAEAALLQAEAELNMTRLRVAQEVAEIHREREKLRMALGLMEERMDWNFEALLALADQCEFLCFVVRGYGILATTKERAVHMDAPAIPPDIPVFVPEAPGPSPVE